MLMLLVLFGFSCLLVFFQFDLKRNKNKKIIQFSAGCLVVAALAACNHSPQGTGTTGTSEKNNNVQEESKKVAVAKKKTEIQQVLEPATPEKLKNAVFTSLSLTPAKGEQRFTHFAIDHDNNVAITLKAYQDLNPNLTVFRIKQDISNVLWGIKKSKLNVYNVNLITTYSTPDQSGTLREKQILNVTFTKETIQKTDFESYNTDNILSVADKVTFLDPSFAWK